MHNKTYTKCLVLISRSLYFFEQDLRRKFTNELVIKVDWCKMSANTNIIFRGTIPDALGLGAGAWNRQTTESKYTKLLLGKKNIHNSN